MNLPASWSNILRKLQHLEAFHHANRDKRIILDEVQCLPDVFVPIRDLIDAERHKGNRHPKVTNMAARMLDGYSSVKSGL